MRICLFTSTVDVAALGKETLLSRLNSSIDPNMVTEIHALTYRLPQPGVEPSNLHFLPGEDTCRMTLCRRFFRIIDATSCIPTFLALIPLWLCSKEICESLLAIDPDVILFSEVRWRHYLHRLLRKHHPYWTCLPRLHQPLPSVRPWRQFDPTATVSIILPTYNGSRYLRQSIESCLKQTFHNIELIVVDDGSTEDIEAIVREYDDCRIRVLRHVTNLGLPHALNTGFKHSTGDYLTWTSDDNYYAQNAIEAMLRFLQTYPEIDFVYADNYLLIEGDGYSNLQIQRNKPVEWLREDNYIGACYLYRRKVYEGTGEFDTRAFLAEDYDYWIRVSRQFRMQRLFTPLYYYRHHKDSLSSKYGRQRVLEKTRLVKHLNSVRAK